MLDGSVIGECHGRHRQEEFLKFLRQLHSAFSGWLDLYFILDNYGTHEHPTTRNAARWDGSAASTVKLFLTWPYVAGHAAGAGCMMMQPGATERV